MSSTAVDSLEQEIFRYVTRSIADELEINITRTAYSHHIKESQDYCIALMTPDFRTYVQSEASIPIFVSDMGDQVRDVVAVIGADRLQPGDVFASNYDSGQHLNNAILATPLFHGDEISGYLAIRSHWADVGGLITGGQSMDARSIFHEGTRYRGLRLVRAGTVEPEVLATIQANTYQVDALTGDIMAQVTACLLGARRWEERVVERWDRRQVGEIVDAQLAASSAFARRAIRGFRDGTYRAEHPWRIDHGDDSLDLTLAVQMTIDGDGMVVDLSDMPPQSTLPINAGRVGGAMAAVRLAFRYLIPGDYPTDDGFFEPIDFVIPEGTIVSASADAPMGFWNTTMPLLIDLVVRAFGEADPESVPAAHFASVGGILISGRHSDGAQWRYIEPAIGGLGAEADRDGYGPVKSLFLGNMRSLPIEMIEGSTTLRVDGIRLLPESGGIGLHRGGPGVERLYSVTSDVAVTFYPEPTEPAPGLAGGGGGKLGSIHVMPPGTDRWLLPNDYFRGNNLLPAGSRIRQRTGGGGGWGRPEGDQGMGG